MLTNDNTTQARLDIAFLLLTLVLMRIMLRRYQTVTILSVLLAGVWSSSVSADVFVKGMLSTGETFDGKLVRDDGRRLTVKGEKRGSTLTAANIVECMVRVAGEKIPADLPALRYSGRAKFLLAKGHDFLAEAAFLCALTRTARSKTPGELTLHLWAMETVPWEKLIEGQQTQAIKAAYTKARRKLPVRLGGRKTVGWRPRRYQLPPPRTIVMVLEQIDQWGLEMKRIAPRTHRIETAHFIIYSAWSKTDDAKLKGIYEKLYNALCKQFDMPATENLWIGRLPVFAFWEKKDFVEFCVKICGISAGMAHRASGFSGFRGAFQYVNLGPIMMKGMSKTQARTRFYELLVHESTHAFLNRYINSGYVTNWLNEGIAEMLSATFVPKGDAPRKLQAAHAAVKRGKGMELLPMFSARNIPLTGEAYGAAQSLARFLVAKGKSRFIQLVTQIKDGVDSDTALDKVYGLSHKKLLQAWIKKVR